MSPNNRKPFTVALLVALSAAIVLAACGAPAATQPAAAPTNSASPVPAATESPATVPAKPSAAPAEPTAVPTEPQASGSVSFSQDLVPIFEEFCIKCHGGEETEKGLDMKTHTALLAGSERGAVIVPGDADGSRLAQLILNGKMPKRGPKPSAEQIQLIINWINAGAQNN